MKIGDLVRNTRASIGLPVGLVGLIIDIESSDDNKVNYAVIQWLSKSLPAFSIRMRRLFRDLEVVNASG